MKFDKGQLLQDLGLITLLCHGDRVERSHGNFIIEGFSNYEKVWRNLQVPLTKRVDQNEYPRFQNIWPRDGIAPEIQNLAYKHYSILSNLFISLRYFTDYPPPAPFEGFYIHLGVTLDLAESFLEDFYLLVNRALNVQSRVLQQLSEDEFVEDCRKWYQQNYSCLYDHYFSRGKGNPIRIPGRKHILDEFFNSSEEFSSYQNYARQIREYRNVMVHDSRIRQTIGREGDPTVFVPRKEFIQKYRGWINPDLTGKDRNCLKDFVSQKDQMLFDLIRLKDRLNPLWQVVDKTFCEILWEKETPDLLKMMNIEFIGR